MKLTYVCFGLIIGLYLAFENFHFHTHNYTISLKEVERLTQNLSLIALRFKAPVFNK